MLTGKILLVHVGWKREGLNAVEENICPSCESNLDSLVG
jgi:hypothetical protein